MYIKNGKRITLTTGMVVEVAAKDADGKDIVEEVQLVLPVSAERLAELGITEVPDPVRPDDRFYFVSENADGTFAATPKPRAQTNAMIWEQIKAKRDNLTENGGYKVGTKWFHSDQKSRSQQLGLVLLGASIPAGLQWKTMDGTFVTMTQTLAQQVLAAAGASDQAIFAAAETHKAALEACADPSAYDFSGGWPAAFKG